MAYGDDQRYVPYVKRAYAGWEELERTVGKSLLTRTGLILMGKPDSQLITSTRVSAGQHMVQLEQLDQAEIERRWPLLGTDADMCGVWDPSGGILHVEACIDALLTRAVDLGGELRFNEKVRAWKADSDSVEVRSDNETYRAQRLVICAGPWCGTLLAELGLPLWVERQVQIWLKPVTRQELFAPERCPIFSWEHGVENVFYGFPDLGRGVKVAHHHGGPRIEPDGVNRALESEDIDSVRRLLARFLPDANGAILDHDVCMYTNTPDKNFLIDFHPQHSQVLIVGGCSGHGFKFASMVGELVWELFQEADNDSGLEMFRLNRL
tara:strand:+ start:97 stop:1065 length:969 start_codon:yes stop_codon:yes gene_type:complete